MDVDTMLVSVLLSTLNNPYGDIGFILSISLNNSLLSSLSISLISSAASFKCLLPSFKSSTVKMKSLNIIEKASVDTKYPVIDRIKGIP